MGAGQQGVRRETRRASSTSSMRRSRHERRSRKLWGFCHTLRHDGIDYGDYIEQITYLLFLKMADERGDRRFRPRMRLADAPRQDRHRA